jgi:hypothetical protein
MPDEIRTYNDLQKQYRRALRAQHPEWVQTSGECPTCDDYERRLAGLLNIFWPDRAWPADSSAEPKQQTAPSSSR